MHNRKNDPMIKEILTLLYTYSTVQIMNIYKKLLLSERQKFDLIVDEEWIAAVSRHEPLMYGAYD